MHDIAQRLRNFCVWNNRHSHYDPVPVCQEGAAEIERLRAALKPFADYYDLLERNDRLEGHMLVSQQGDAILGHAGVQTRDLKMAREAFNQQSTSKED